MSQELAARRIEDDPEFLRLVIELNQLELFALAQEKLTQQELEQKETKIERIKAELYRLFKEAINSENTRETDLFNDLEYLDRLTGFNQITLQNFKEKKALIERYGIFLSTNQKKLKTRRTIQIRSQSIAELGLPLAIFAFVAVFGLTLSIALGLLGLSLGIPLIIGFFLLTGVGSCVFYYEKMRHQTALSTANQNIVDNKRNMLALDKVEMEFDQKIIQALGDIRDEQNEQAASSALSSSEALDKSENPSTGDTAAKLIDDEKVKCIASFINAATITVRQEQGAKKYTLRFVLSGPLEQEPAYLVLKNDLLKESQIDFVQNSEKIKNKDDIDGADAEKKHHYEIELNQAQVNKIKNFLKSEVDKDAILKNDFFIKAIRADHNDFFSTSFLWGITRSLKQFIKFPMRNGEKGKHRVDGADIHKAGDPENKVSKERYQGERPFSQTQSVSIAFKGLISDLFGHDKEKPRLSGVGFLNPEDVCLSNRLRRYDGGTVDIKNQYNSKAKARNYLKVKSRRAAADKIVYPRHEINSFKKALVEYPKGTLKGQSYNEVLAGIRWNMDGSTCLLMGTDDLETRLLTLHRAKILRERLKKQAEENEWEFDENYIVPIYFYFPDNPEKHFAPYDVFQQKEDELTAVEIAKDRPMMGYSKSQQKYKAKDYEFLLSLDETTLESLIKYNSPIKKLIEEKRLSILMPVLQKLTPATLEKIISESGDVLVETLLNHPHHFYPEIMDNLMNKNIHQKSKKHALCLFKMAVLQERTDVIETIFKEYMRFENYADAIIDSLSDMFFQDSGQVKLSVKKLKDLMNMKFMDDALNSYAQRNSSKILALSDTRRRALHFIRFLNNDLFNVLHDSNFYNEDLESGNATNLFDLAISFEYIELMEKLYTEKIKNKVIQNFDLTRPLEAAIKYGCWKSVKWMIENDVGDVKKLSINSKDELLAHVVCKTSKTPCFKIIANILQDGDYIKELSKKPIYDAFCFLVWQGKYKLFKSFASLIAENTHIKSQLLKLSKEALCRCHHIEITAFLNCLNFVSDLNNNDFSKLAKLPLSSVKHLQSGDLDFILTHYLDQTFSQKRELIKWVFEKIKNPESNNTRISEAQKLESEKLLSVVIAQLDISAEHKVYLRKRLLGDRYKNPYRWFKPVTQVLQNKPTASSALSQAPRFCRY